MRIGHGFDVHGFEAGDALILGGVRIPFNKQFKAHSDGDVLIHALCDALLGAAGLGDIGKHFPDSDKRFENIDSRKLLRQVVALLEANSLKMSNIDITVIAQQPRLAGYIDAMKANLSSDLAIDIRRINIKATTTEGLGFTGRQEGVAAHAVCLLLEH